VTTQLKNFETKSYSLSTLNLQQTSQGHEMEIRVENYMSKIKGSQHFKRF